MDFNSSGDGYPSEEGIDMGEFGSGSDSTPCDMPKFIDTDPELAWWNGEEGGKEPK